MGCATEDCGTPDCPVCSVPRRFPQTAAALGRPDELKRSAPALNGTKPARTNRDPTFIKRRRKPL